MQVLSSNSRNVRNKENGGSSPSKEMQRLKVELNDRIFQYHRLEEDYAQEKARLVIDFQKQRGHLNKTIKELKDKNQNDTEDWIKKMDQMRNEKEEALKLQSQQHEALLEQHQIRIKCQIQKEFNLEVNSLQRSLSDSQKQVKRKCQEWKKEKEQLITSLTNNFSRKEEELNKGYQAMLEGMKREFQEKYNQVQYLYIKEEENRKKIQKCLEDKLREHGKQNIIQEGINIQLTQENETLKEDICKLEGKVKQIQKQLQLSQKNHEEEKKRVVKQHIDELSKAKLASNAQNEQIIEIHSQHIMQLKSQMSALETLYREKEKLWDERGRKMLQLYEKRESKREDVKAIETLEVELIKKDFMLEKERNELKHCKLQLENMEQIYDKMFLSNNYLGKVKAKSFKVKKMRAALNNSNNRSMIQNRKSTVQDSK